jgi:hypothetical protein
MEIQKLIFPNSLYYHFPIDYFTSSTILLPGLNISQMLCQSLPRRIKDESYLLLMLIIVFIIANSYHLSSYLITYYCNID